MNKYPDVFDGLDIDLEYPCVENDKACGDKITPGKDDRGNFALLIEEFRRQMGTSKLLTLATSADPLKADALDFARLNPIVDGYNIMSYDFTSGSWGDAYTGHQTATYSNPADPVVGRRSWSSFTAA
jgi:chitinase